MGTEEEQKALHSEFIYVLNTYNGDQDPTPYVTRAIMEGKAPTIAKFIERNDEDIRTQIIETIRELREEGSA